jgi:hypothetical protein
MNTTTATALMSRINHNTGPPFASKAGNDNMRFLYVFVVGVQRAKFDTDQVS